MKYYKVIKGDIYDRKTQYTTIPNELLTPKERKKMFPSLSNSCFEETEVNKKNTWYGFGGRFKVETNHNGIRKEN